MVTANPSGDALSSLSLINTLNSNPAGESLSIKSGSVKIWRVSPDTSVFDPSDTATTTQIGTMAVSGSTGWSASLLNQSVINGDGIWVTVDISSFPSFGVIQMQSSSISFSDNPAITSSNKPASPPSLLVISYIAANNLEVYHSNGNMQSYVSTGQNNIIAYKLNFINNSGTTSAPAQITSVAINVDAAQVPSGVISDIKIQDANQGTLYGELTDMPSTVSPMNIPVSINIPASSTITVNVLVTISADSASAGKNFAIDLVSAADVSALDYYTGRSCAVSAAPYDSFPLQSTFTTIRKKALQCNMAFDGSVIPATISKGQTNVPLYNLTFTNPGDASSAFIEVYSIKVHLKDNSGAAVVPASLFSKISITNQAGDTTYGYKASATLETSGGTVTIPLANPISIAPETSVTVTVKADILTSTTLNNFKAGVEALPEIKARDKNSFLDISVIDPAALPYYSNLALLSSSFIVSLQPSMPANIYKGQSGINAGTFTFSTPLIYGAGSLIVRGITLTVKDAGGSALQADSILSGLTAVTAHGTFSSTAIPSSSQIYIPLSLTLSSSSSSEAVSISISAQQDASSLSLQLALDSASMVDSYQDTDMTRKISISTVEGVSFPLSCGIGYLSGSASSTSFSSYPNPFRSGSFARFAYYLEGPSKVTIKIYDISGSLVKTIIDKSDRSAGSHNEDTWDGRSGSRFVMAGTYLAEITIKPASGKDKKTVTKITFIK